MYIPLHNPWSLEQGSKKRTASGTVRNSVKLLLLDQALVLHWWMGWAQLFVCHCLCMTWFLVHPLTSPYMVYLLHIIDVLIFSVRFSVVGGKIQFQFCAPFWGRSNQQLFHLNTAWVSSCFGLNGFALGPIQLGQKIVQKFGKVYLKFGGFKVLTHYVYIYLESTLFYGVLCIQGGDIFGFLFTINRINRIQR